MENNGEIIERTTNGKILPMEITQVLQTVHHSKIHGRQLCVFILVVFILLTALISIPIALLLGGGSSSSDGNEKQAFTSMLTAQTAFRPPSLISTPVKTPSLISTPVKTPSLISTPVFSSLHSKSILSSSVIAIPSTSIVLVKSIVLPVNPSSCKSDESIIKKLSLHGDPRWNCDNNSCILTCKEDGFKSFAPQAVCGTDNSYDDTWRSCILINPCIKNPCRNEHSICHNDYTGNYRCLCDHGFAGNGKQCVQDTDLDGFPDKNANCKENTCCKDNCPYIPNIDQIDTDSNGVGDSCEITFMNHLNSDVAYKQEHNGAFFSGGTLSDLDDDGVPNDCDNCIYLNNSNQVDVNGNGIGDICEGDTDGDGILDIHDDFPTNSSLQTNHLLANSIVRFGDKNESATFTLNKEGTELFQKNLNKKAQMILYTNTFENVHFTGVFQSNYEAITGNLGVVFGFKNKENFVMFEFKLYTNKSACVLKSIEGLHSSMLWSSDDLVFHANKTYRWELEVYLHSSLINFQLYDEKRKMISTKEIFEKEYTGGRVGIYSAQADNVIFSKLNAKVPLVKNYGVVLTKELSLGKMSDHVGMNKTFLMRMRLVTAVDLPPMYCMLDTFDTNDNPALKGLVQSRDDDGNWKLMSNLTNADIKGRHFVAVNSTSDDYRRYSLQTSSWFMNNACWISFWYTIHYTGTDTPETARLLMEYQVVGGDWQPFGKAIVINSPLWQRAKTFIGSHTGKLMRVRLTAAVEQKNWFYALEEVRIRCNKKWCDQNYTILTGLLYVHGNMLKAAGNNIFPFNSLQKISEISLSYSPKKQSLTVEKEGSSVSIPFAFDYSKDLLVAKNNLLDEIRIWSDVEKARKLRGKYSDESFSGLNTLYRFGMGTNKTVKNEVYGGPPATLTEFKSVPISDPRVW